MKQGLRWCLPLAVVGLLAGCVEPSVTVRPERRSDTEIRPSSPPRTPSPGVSSYEVQQGDTLFRIAFRFQTTVDELVRLNGIVDRNRILVGQRLRIGSAHGHDSTELAQVTPPTAPSVPSVAEDEPASVGVPVDDATLGASQHGVPPDAEAPLPEVNLVDGPDRVVPASDLPAEPAPSVAAIDPEATMPSPETATPVPPPHTPAGPPLSLAAPTAVRNGWSWPVAGRLIGTFVTGDATRSGIDIAGVEGQPVYAANDGEVLFSGTGIIGYGELIVIQHPNGLLSAYGHSRKRLVNEGAKIKRGQQIAEMGRDSSGRELLHFEVRKAGKPVDPLAYLPGR